MLQDIIPIKIFLISDSNSLLSEIGEKFKKASLLLLEDFFAALAHAHLEPDFIFIFGILERNDIPISNFIEKLSELSPSTRVIFAANEPEYRQAVQLMKIGLGDYIAASGFDSLYLSTLLEAYSGEKWNPEEKIRTGIVEKFRGLGFMGSGRRMRKLYRMIEDASKSELSLLFEAEVGCELLEAAGAAHKLSKRREGPFVLFDVLAYQSETVEFELFGREKDSNAGIEKRKTGAIETASGGSLCIENVDALPMHIQSRLLRAIREKKYLKPGGPNIVFWNTRLICISWKNLEKSIKFKQLREDLFYQIAAFNIRVPPLRARGQDIILLANHFLRTFVRINRLKAMNLSQAAKDKLLEHYFSGNVLELKSVIETAALLSKGEEIEKENIIFREKPIINLISDGEQSLEKYNEFIINTYLEKYNNDVLAVAARLGIGKSTIYRMLQSNKISKKTSIQND
jgi:DNA-binding NtrC family response regulator